MIFKNRLKEYLEKGNKNSRINCFIELIIKIYSVGITLKKIIFKVVDFILTPFSIYMGNKGYFVFKVKTSSFGHHLQEPVAIALEKKSLKNKKIILLASKKKAVVQFTNTLLKQKFNVIEDYNCFNYLFWLARSKHCGLSSENLSHIETTNKIYHKQW